LNEGVLGAGNSKGKEAAGRGSDSHESGVNMGVCPKHKKIMGNTDTCGSWCVHVTKGNNKGHIY
jgi:hypothetical protein